MLEVDDGVPLPREVEKEIEREAKREAALRLARSFYQTGNFGKSTAAKMAIEELGLWAVIEPQSAVDYLRNNI